MNSLTDEVTYLGVRYSVLMLKIKSIYTVCCVIYVT